MTTRPSYLLLGGSGGIGSAIARRLSAAPGGVNLFLAARDADKLGRLAAELRGDSRIETATLDATQPPDVERAIAHAAETFGGLTGIANCVGSILLKPAHQTTDAELETTLRLNLWSAFATIRGAAKAMRASGGSVLLFSTAAARCGLPNHDAIAAAKAGVIGLTLSAAATYATNNIRVNCVAPGLVDTPLAGAITHNDAALKASTAMHALGRIGTPADIAPVAAWLLSPESAWVSGQVFGVDGGLATLRPRLKL